MSAAPLADRGLCVCMFPVLWDKDAADPRYYFVMFTAGAGWHHEFAAVVDDFGDLVQVAR